jgi:hypothetical protein
MKKKQEEWHPATKPFSFENQGFKLFGLPKFFVSENFETYLRLRTFLKNFSS